jgi:hypothetical protein
MITRKTTKIIGIALIVIGLYALSEVFSNYWTAEAADRWAYYDS